MIMKKSILSMLLVLTCWAQASAYSFEVDGIYYNKNGSNATVTYRDNNYNSYSGEVTIPSTVTFDGTTYTVTAIGDCAFMNCTNLKAIDIPEGVTIFGSSAFKNCASLESVIIPEGVTAISYQCFFGCSNLKELTIPASVTFINEGYSGGVSTSAFYGCDALSTLTWNAVRCDSRGNMPTANIETVNIGDEVTLLPNYFVKDSKITHVEIPATVTNIGDYAFSGCTGLAEIAIPDNVTVLSHAVFDGCSNLATAKLPANATAIGDYAFQSCIALTEIVMPESVASIGNCAFNGCSNLASAKLPTEASYIGECAFKNCSSLESVIIPEGVTSIPVSCFFGCSNLKVLTIPSTVTSIYASYGYSAFQFCDALTTLTWNAVRCESRGGMPTANIETVTIGGQVTLLPNYFVRNSKITQVDIPATVTSIGDYAFAECGDLTTVTCRSITPPAMAAHNCFDCYKTAILFVPKAAVDTYLGADYWKEFFEIIGINFDTIPGDVNGDGSVNITDLNIIIGLILSNEYNYAADLNNDRSVNISDVNMIIFIILNGTSTN